MQYACIYLLLVIYYATLCLKSVTVCLSKSYSSVGKKLTITSFVSAMKYVGQA